MFHSILKASGFALLILTVFIAVYFATYVVSVNDRTFTIVKTSSSNHEDAVILPTYRFGGENAKSIFCYAHKFDRAVRRGYWSP
jgi:hypothetical protein